MQGSQINILTQNDKVNAFMEKLEFWKRNIERDTYFTFPTFGRETETNKRLFIDHMGAV
jgi:hypothetical protein